MNDQSGLFGAKMNRRRLLQLATVTGVGVTVSGLLAACGGDTDSDDEPTSDETASSGWNPTESGATAESANSTEGSATTTSGGESAVDGGQAPAPEGATRGGTLVVANEADMNEGDPQKYSGTHAGRTLRNLFDPLVTVYDDSSELQGALAESWEISEDGLTYTFNLRDAKFHDGNPVTAEAAAFTFLRALDENNEWYQETGPFPFARFIWPYVVTDQITAVDDKTLQFGLSQVDSTFLSNMTWAGSGIISPEALKASGRDFTLQPVGAGPFKFSSWEKGTSFTIERFDDYWGGAPLLDTVIFKPAEESAARLVQLQGSDVDLVAALPPEFMAEVESDANLELHQTEGIHIWWVTLNTHDEHLKDKRVRQALNYAIDKEAIINDILAGAGVVSTSFGFPNTPSYTDDVQTYPYDPEQAKALLAEAGFPDGFSTVFLVPESGSGMVAPKEIATIMQSQLKEVGVDAEIQTLEWTSYITAYGEGLDNAGEQQVGMAQMSYMIPQPDLGMYATDVLSSTSTFNTGYYENPELDEIILQAKGEVDADRRNELYQEAQQIVADDAPWIFMFHAFNVVAANKKVKNIVLNPDFNILHLERVYIEE